LSMNFEVTEQAEQPVLSVRTRTNVADLPGELGKAYSAIIAYLEEVGEKTEGPAFAAYYNMDMENLDVEMGFPVEKPVAGKGGISQSAIPAGRQAVCMYKGPYTQMGPTYEAMTAWMKEKGCEPTGVVYEFYYNSPADVPESELLTKIVFLLK
jgi:effector-binding domain-containing protein